MPKIVTIKIPNTLYRKLFKKKEQDGFGNKSLNEYLQFLTKTINLTPTIHDYVQESTKTLLDMWIKNFSDNLPYIRFGNTLTMNINKYDAHNLSELALPEPTFENPSKHSAIVIGRGPSIFTHKHLDLLSEAIKQGNYTGIISSTDGMLIECLKHDILPTLTTSVDGSPIIQKWYDNPLVKGHGKNLKIALSTTVNHLVYQTVRKMGCKIFWFHPMFDDPKEVEGLTRIQRMMTISDFNDKPIQALSCGGNSGASAWVMAMNLFKATPCCLIGIDFSYPEGTKLEDTPYFSSFIKASKGKVDSLSEVYKKIYHPIFKSYAYIDAVFQGYKQTFLEYQEMTPAWYRYYDGTINATEGGALWGRGITCMSFKQFLEKYKK